MVTVHRHLLPDRPQHLGQRIAAGPAPQPAPEGGPGFESKALALEAMGRAAGLVVGFEHQHLEAMAGCHGGGAEPPQPAANHQQIRPRGRSDAV